MSYISFDQSKEFDLVLLGKMAIDFNPAYNEQVKGEFKPLKNIHTFGKFAGGFPANISVGTTKRRMKAGFIGRVPDDQFGEYVIDYFDEQGIDTSQVNGAQHGEELGLTSTEVLSPKESSILMYQNQAVDLQLSVEDIDEDYLKCPRALLISGTALTESPSRETVLEAVMLVKKNNVKIIFDIDCREYSWKNVDEIAIYYSIAAKESDIIIGSREEFDLTGRLIQPNITDNENAVFWHNCDTQIVVIKHGMKGSTVYTADHQQFSIKPFPVETRRGFGGGDGYAAGFLYGLFEDWEIIDCLEFDSAEVPMMVKNDNCSGPLPTAQEVKEFVRLEKGIYGEMIARIQGR